MVVCVFLLIFTLAFLHILLVGDTEDKTMQKILGGTAVFTLSLVTGNVIVIVLALFIGGLIIASERFLEFLLAVVKSDSKNLPETLSEMNKRGVVITRATPEDLEEKTEKEEEESAPQVINMPNQRETFQERMDKRKDVETKSISLLSDHYTGRFSAGVRLANEFGNLIADGVIHSRHIERPDSLDDVNGLIEVIYMPGKTERLKMWVEHRLRTIVSRFRFLFIDKQILIVYVLDREGFTEDAAIAELTRVFDKYNVRETKDVLFGLLVREEDGSVVQIFLPEISDKFLRTEK